MTAPTSLGYVSAWTGNHILTTLEKTGWVVDGPDGAAKIVALRPNTLRSRMKKLGIVRAPRTGRS